MAEPLEFDIEFRSDSAAAEAALGRIQDSADQLGRAVTDAFDTAQNLATALSSGIDTSGLEAAAAALGQLGTVDLTTIADAAGQLDQATGPADQIAAALGQAADSATGIATGIDVDPTGAETLAASLDQAAAASQGIGEGVQLELFAAAAADVDSLAAGLTTAADAGREAADAADNVASGLSAAASAVDELAAGAADTGTQLSLFGDQQDKVSEGVKKTTEQQTETNEKVREGVDAAALLGAEFHKIQGKIGEIAGPMGRFAEQAVEAVGALEGVGGLATGGIAAGAIGLLAAGESFHNASITIALATGATGGALEELQDAFKTSLEGSARSAGDLAVILGDLSRDAGATGDQLASLTDNTAKFLKVTNGSVGDVRSLTQAMISLGLGADQLKGFEDELATVTTHFGVSLSSLLQQIKVAGPVLSTFGLNPGQIAGLIGELDQAGLSFTRLVPGLTKLATTAATEGKTGAEALTDFIARIKGANDSTAALTITKEIFSGRVAAQFSNAVQRNAVDIDKLNEVMAESPGTVSRLGDAVKGVGGQFGAIRNEILATFGQQGLPLIEGLRDGIAAIRPTLRELFNVLGDLSPAFKGFAEAAFLPVAALRFLETPLHLLADVLDLIPAPLLEVVGVFAAMKLLPFGIISTGLVNVAAGMQGFLTFGGGPAGAIRGVGGALSAINPLILVAGAGLVTLFAVMHHRSQDAEEARKRVDALAEAVGSLSSSAAEAAPKIEELLSEGSKGGLISDEQLANIAELGATLALVTDTAQALATGNRTSIETLTRQIVDLEKASIAAGHAFDAGGGLGLSHINEAAAGTKEAIGGIVTAINEQAKAQLDQLTVSGQITAADRVAAAVKLGLKDETEGEARVRDLLVAKLHSERAAKAGLATADDAENQIRGAILDGLEKEGALHDKVVDATKQHTQVVNELAAASRGGVASDEDRVAITERLVASGLSQEDAVKALAAAEQELQAIQAKYTPSTLEMNAALQRAFQLIGQGVPVFDALNEAAHEGNVDVSKLGGNYDTLAAALQKIAPPAQASADAMASLAQSQLDGLNPAQTQAALLTATGDNADAATVAIEEYAKGVADTQKAVDALVPSLGSVISKLEDQAKISLTFGSDAAGQADAIQQGADASRAALDQQTKDLEAAKQARSEADQASLDAQKKALEDQKSLAQDAAKARGEVFDSTALDLQIQALKAKTDTSDLDAQIKDLQGRQKDIDAGLARAHAALQVFSDEEAAIRGSSALRDTDIASQITQLAAARDLAAQTAAARGQAFDTTSFDQKIVELQTKRDALSGQTDQAIVDAQTSSAKVQAAVTDAQGGLLDFGAVLDTFQAQMTTKINEATTIAELQAQGFGDIVKFLFDPNAALSDSERSQRLNAIATLTPEERQAFEAKAKAALAAEDAAAQAVGGLGDLFAKPNQVAVDHATTRGQELAKGITDGFVKQLDESKINEIIDLVIKTGVSPTDARKFVQDQIAAARRAQGGPVTATPGSLASVGINADMVAAAEQALGGAGTTAGALYVAEVQEAIRTTGIDPDAAAAMLAPVQDQLPVLGAAGGASVASTVADTIRNSPIDADAASVLVENLRTQLPIEGAAGGAGYAQAVPGGMALYPVPTDAGIILVSTIAGALTVAGTDAGANYALSVAAGIAAREGDAISAAHLMAIRVDEAGHAGLEAASPSKKGLRLGAFWAEGVALGIRGGLDDVARAAGDVSNAVDVQPAIDISNRLTQAVAAGVSPAVPALTAAAVAAAAPVPAGAGVRAGAPVNIENVNVVNPVDATSDEVVHAIGAKLGWLLTTRNER